MFFWLNDKGKSSERKSANFNVNTPQSHLEIVMEVVIDKKNVKGALAMVMVLPIVLSGDGAHAHIGPIRDIIRNPTLLIFMFIIEVFATYLESNHHHHHHRLQNQPFSPPVSSSHCHYPITKCP